MAADHPGLGANRRRDFKQQETKLSSPFLRYINRRFMLMNDGN
jgi:hypothetical protein